MILRYLCIIIDAALERRARMAAVHGHTA